MAKKKEKSAKREEFKVTYFEECAENLELAETQLNSLRNASDRNSTEELNGLFRSVHSIKGGAGAFGFAGIISFSHKFEAVLEKMRGGTLEVSDAALNCLVSARDVLAALVEAVQDEKPLADDQWKEIASELDALAGSEAKVKNSDPSEEESDNGPLTETFHIEFKPSSKFFLNGSDPLPVIRELRQLGELEVEIDTSNIPPLSELSPDQSYLSWTFEITTQKGLDAINDIFEFVGDICDLHIESHSGHSANKEKDGVSPASVSSARDIGSTTKEQSPSLQQEDLTPSVAQSKILSEKPKSAPPQTAPPPKTTSIRVDLNRVDKLVNMVGEIVITQAILEQYSGGPLNENDDVMLRGIETLSTHMRELQENVMAIRMQPVKSVFSRMPRLVRELSRQLNKKVKLTMEGENTEVDKTVIELLTDPLTHMIRNSLDHGIESVDERMSAGKNEEAEVVLSASHRSGRIVIEVTDDGVGINRERVFQKAVENGLVEPGINMSSEEIDNLIFMPGFSTAQEVTDVSGRGVGMDVVRRSVQDLGGRISVESWPGKGARFIMSLPLTLAVMDGMIVRVGDEKYVLPTACIVESIQPQANEIQTLMDHAQVVHYRDDYVPLVPLHRLFNVQNAIDDPCNSIVIFAETDTGKIIGLVVDELLGQRQIVIKSLEENYMHIEGVSAVTILGDGKVALILEMEGLIAQFKSQGKNEIIETEIDGLDVGIGP